MIQKLRNNILRSSSHPWHRYIQNPVKHLKMEHFWKILNVWKSLTRFAKRSILVVWHGSEYNSVEYAFCLCKDCLPENSLKKYCFAATASFMWHERSEWDSDSFLDSYPCKNIFTWETCGPYSVTLHKKWSFPLRISSVNVTKSAVLYGFLNGNT